MIEGRRLAPYTLDDFHPFFREAVARVVRDEIDAEHIKFAMVPARNDVQRKAALADVIGRHHLLG